MPVNTKDNHYDLLGVARSATPDEIKSAYRKLARRYHPDVSTELDASEKIKLVNEAYTVLGEPEKREAYDRQLDGTAHYQFQGATAGAFPGNLHHLFENLFAHQHTQTRQYLAITLEQAFKGGTILVEGEGRSVDIELPAGILEGDTLKDPILGDLIIRYAPHPRFQWQEGHILSQVILPPWITALGGKLKVETLGGEVEVYFPPGLKEGQRVRLHGRGMPPNGGHAPYDHLCVVQWGIAMPSNEDQRRAYQTLARSFGAQS